MDPHVSQNQDTKHYYKQQYYTIATEQSAVEVENHEPFGAKWSMFCRLKVRSYVLAANVAGTLKVAPLQILKFPVVLPHKFLDAEKFNLRFSDASEITEIADKLRWYRYQKGLRQRDAADYAGIDRSTYIHYEEAGRDFYPKEHMEKLARIWLQGEPGEAFYQQLFDYMQGCGIYGKDENGIWNRFCDAQPEKGEKGRDALKRWYWFPPYEYMVLYYPWLSRNPVAGKFLLPAAWGIRAVRGVVCGRGKYKREMLRQIDASQIGVRQDIYRRLQLRFH